MEKTLVVKAVAVVALAAGCFFWGSAMKDNQWQAKWAARDASDLAASLDFTTQQRRIELERQGELDAIQKKADADLAVAAANTDRARIESDRLREGVEKALEQLRGGGQLTGTAASSKTRDATGVLLAQLYREIDTAATEYAGEADRARAAGLRCEAAWDAVRNRR